MLSKNIFQASKPVTYILLPTSSEAPKDTNKSSKADKSKGAFLKTQDSVRNLSKQPPENCEYCLPEPENFYHLDLCPLEVRNILTPELQTHVPIPKATEIYIPENSTARLQLMDQACGFRKNANPALHPPRKASSASAMKTPSADAMKIPSVSVMMAPSASVMKTPSASVMKVPSASVMKVPSASVIKVPPASVMKVPSASVIKVPSASVMKVPSASVMKVPSASVMKAPSADVMKVPSIAIVKAPPSVASKRPSAGVTKPRTKNQPKNQKKQDKEEHSLTLDLVLVNPNQSTPATQRLPIPEATK
ncbi:hypothetical protein A6R68_11206, partial [Neotoma lepida]